MSEYTLHTKSNGDLIINANLQTPNANVVGQTQTYEFWLESYYGDKIYRSDATIASNETREFATVTIQPGVTLTVNGTLKAHNITVDGDLVVNGDVIVVADGDMELNTLLEYAEWAGKYETSRMINGAVKYRERLPTSGAIDSLVVGLEPSGELVSKNVNGVWALIDSLSDQRGPTLHTNIISITLTVLGNYTDYASHTAVENDLKL